MLLWSFSTSDQPEKNFLQKATMVFLPMWSTENFFQTTLHPTEMNSTMGYRFSIFFQTWSRFAKNVLTHSFNGFKAKFRHKCYCDLFPPLINLNIFFLQKATMVFLPIWSTETFFFQTTYNPTEMNSTMGYRFLFFSEPVLDLAKNVLTQSLTDLKWRLKKKCYCDLFLHRIDLRFLSRRLTPD